MIETINDKNYVIDKFESITLLANQYNLKDLSLEEWSFLLSNIRRKCSFIDMYTILLNKVSNYNTDLFYYKDNSYWFDKSMRSSLKTLVDSDPETITLVLGDNFVVLPTEKVKLFLSELEIYSANCYVTKHRHLQLIKELKNVEEIIKYDFTLNYPEKIILND